MMAGEWRECHGGALFAGANIIFEKEAFSKNRNWKYGRFLVSYTCGAPCRGDREAPPKKISGTN